MKNLKFKFQSWGPFLICLIFLATSCETNDSVTEINTVDDYQNLATTLLPLSKVDNIDFTEKGLRVTMDDRVYNLVIERNVGYIYDNSYNFLGSTPLDVNQNFDVLTDANYVVSKDLELINRNPDHEGETFCECVANDTAELCSDVPGCIVSLTPLAQLLIVVHCASETGSTSCS